VVIVGGGFGGLYAARSLAGAPVQVTVVDRKNHHTFQPLLYQVASAALSPGDIAAPIRGILSRQANARVVLGNAERIDTARKTVTLSDGAVLEYDALIVATGATHSYFGHDDWAAPAPGLKTLEDAIAIRRRVLLAYEAAEREPDAERRRALMTFVVVGGGPTGVELAGALAEIGRHALARDFRTIDPRDARIILVEGEPRVLPGYPPRSSHKARAQLAGLGVEVHTGARVTAIDAAGVVMSGQAIAAHTVIWAAGVAGSDLGKQLGVPLDRAGRVLVTPTLNIPGHDDVYVIGDLAAAAQQDGQPVPGVAPAAIQGGRYVAEAVLRRLEGRRDLEPFRYRDKGSLATIGRARAVAVSPGGRFQLGGLLAWLAWSLIHIVYLIGFRSRAVVMLQWIWQYLTFARGARLITDPAGSAQSPVWNAVKPAVHSSEVPPSKSAASPRS
jgi:NADH dehydrogenase